MHTGGVDPSVEKVEQGANGDGEVQRFVRPPRRTGDVEVRHGNLRRVVIDLVDEPEQRLVLLVQRRRFHVRQYRLYQLLVPEKLRRNCGVGLQSKRTVVSL